MPKMNMPKDGYSLLLPSGLLDYFEILKVAEEKTQVKIYLEEKNNLSAPVYESKGFYPNVLINNFLYAVNPYYWIYGVAGG
jgi:hypothetical protein